MLRRYSLIVSLVAAGFVLVLSGCSKATQADVTTPVVLTEADASHTMTVPVGGTVEVKLKANITTGYAWMLAKQEGSSVEPKGDMEYIPDANPGDAVGVGGTAVFHFHAAKAGKTTLNFAYGRPWESSATPAQTYTVTIDVK